LTICRAQATSWLGRFFVFAEGQLEVMPLDPAPRVDRVDAGLRSPANLRRYQPAAPTRSLPIVIVRGGVAAGSFVELLHAASIPVVTQNAASAAMLLVFWRTLSSMGLRGVGVLRQDG